MSRGFNMWNYMTYHLVHDYFKAKKKKKTEIQNFEVKNYKAAQKAAEQWIKSVRKFAESSYGVHYPKELYYGATQVLLAVCAEIYRMTIPGTTTGKFWWITSSTAARTVCGFLILKRPPVPMQT